jgi:preprotein translocase subunit YajC
MPILALMTPPPGSGGQMSILLLQVAGFGAVFYFLFIRPQNQARKKHQELLAALKQGDEITTAGGIIGKVKSMKEDRITIESGTASLVVERSRIIRVGDQTAPGQPG